MTADAVTRAKYERARSIVAASLSAVFLWTLVLSVSPALHARVHAESGQAEHICAATLIASGHYEHPVLPPLFGAALPVSFISKISALTPRRVESPFLEASVLEHAPPFSS